MEIGSNLLAINFRARFDLKHEEGDKEGREKKIRSLYKRRINMSQILFEDDFHYTSIFSRGLVDADTVNEVSILLSVLKFQFQIRYTPTGTCIPKTDCS
jgi:hypothetical protein